ncbi:AMP-binding enzyme [Nocardioides astragali]|uniref:AMP-binding enzyme C-terminal domain-containing protein n=1 Tax=Nocardioides astragali TaxID=1776736 RepID=A0ABW2MX18_9ACTN|nr:hypothetical protein [Nocardioides astragali]
MPTHLQRLFAYWDEVGTPYLSSFRLVAHAGAPCPPAVKHRLIELFPPGSTWEFYVGVLRLDRGPVHRVPLRGVAHPARHRRTRSTGAHADHRRGRPDLVRVPEHARFTYLGAPEETAAAWRDTPAGPAFTVGDVGRLDADGYLYLDGRRTDLSSPAVNVYPLEVENAREVPGIEDVVVFGVPDPQWGQRVCAAVVGTAPVDALAAHARQVLAPAKRPKDYTRVPELPMTATGKVRREALPDLLLRDG